jgi:hypothetical protein
LEFAEFARYAHVVRQLIVGKNASGFEVVGHDSFSDMAASILDWHILALTPFDTGIYGRVGTD